MQLFPGSSAATIVHAWMWLQWGFKSTTPNHLKTTV